MVCDNKLYFYLYFFLYLNVLFMFFIEVDLLYVKMCNVYFSYKIYKVRFKINLFDLVFWFFGWFVLCFGLISSEFLLN